MDFLTAEIRTLGGKSLGVLVLQVRTFRTVSVGYHGQGKLEHDGRRYQCQVQLVEIGSKPAAGAAGGSDADAAEPAPRASLEESAA